MWDDDAEEWFDVDDYGHYPIECLVTIVDTDHRNDRRSLCNLKAVPYISLLARVAIELNIFPEEDRGGLSVEGLTHRNTLICLATCTDPTHYGEAHNQLVDNVCLTQMVQLRRMGLFKKIDIGTNEPLRERRYSVYNMVHELCADHDEYYFPERRLRFLVEWDPTSLLETNTGGLSPLYCTTWTSLRKIRIVFGYCIHYYPKKKGICLMFTKCVDDGRTTPFQHACGKFGQKNVMNEVVENIISRYYSEETPLNIVDVLLTAAIDDTIHLDCVFFLLRRRPDVLVDLQLGSINIINDDDDSGGSGNESHRDNNDGDHDGDDRNNNVNSNHETSGEKEDHKDNNVLVDLQSGLTNISNDWDSDDDEKDSDKVNNDNNGDHDRDDNDNGNNMLIADGDTTIAVVKRKNDRQRERKQKRKRDSLK